MSRATTLPTDSEERKGIPLLSGCVNYFPAALAGVARWSKIGNDKHNPGEPLHHARGKSMDHGDCILRHTMDLGDMMARKAIFTEEQKRAILDEVDARSWRALADAQRIHEMFGAPLAPAARLPEPLPDWLVTRPPGAQPPPFAQTAQQCCVLPPGLDTAGQVIERVSGYLAPPDGVEKVIEERRVGAMLRRVAQESPLEVGDGFVLDEGAFGNGH